MYLKRVIRMEEFIFETEWDAIEFAEECGDAFVRYTGTSWKTCEDGVLAQGDY